MGNNTFCTIITANYAHYALALHDSLIQHNNNLVFSIFLSKGKFSRSLQQEIQGRKHIELYDFNDLCSVPLANELRKKYSEDYHDAFRWGMKPVFINFLLESFEKVIYVDSDIYFFHNFNFLFQKLNTSKVLLTPHWRSSTPEKEYSNFIHNFRDGIYNAGFIGAAKGSEDALSWWAKMILFNCEVNRKDGFYVDQRYLDLLPVLFEGVEVLKHKGCNVANWNKVECKRTLSSNSEVLINNEFPIIFIHFTNTMLTGIFYENDTLLKPHLEQYRDNLLKYSNVDIIEEYLNKGKFKTPRSEDDFKPKNKDVAILEKSKGFFKMLYKKLS